MHIYFSGIGGAGLSGLALVAKKAGYHVSGSDKQDSQTIDYLKSHGIEDIHIGQNRQAITAIHDVTPIDWLVYTSAVSIENAMAPELEFCREQTIKTSKRDELLNQIIRDKRLKLVAIAGTHGKSTTTAMVIWLFELLGIPIGYNVGAKLAFEADEFAQGAEYFVYECDEFDRNFLAFEPFLSIISGVSWDHHEIFPTREDYQAAFREFIEQSQRTLIWQEDSEYLDLQETEPNIMLLDTAETAIQHIGLKGLYNRLDSWLAVQAVHRLTDAPVEDLLHHASNFPGIKRRMEQLIPNLYSDYAHTVEKIRGAMSVAMEMAVDSGQNLIVIYEPLHNRRQHYILNDYKDCFAGATQVYWVPSYLAREDPAQRILPPAELITRLDDPSVAVPAELDDDLKRTIQSHLTKGDLVVAMTAGGGGSLDEWLRAEFV